METASIDKQREEKNGKKLTLLDVLVFFLPMSLFVGTVQLTSLQITLPTLLSIAIFLLIVLRKIRNPETRAPASQKQIIGLLLGALVFFLFISNIQNYDFSSALQKIIWFLKNLSFFLDIFLYIQNEQDLEWVGKAFFITGILSAVTMVLAGLNIVRFDYGQTGASRFETLVPERVSGVFGSFGESTLLFDWMLSTTLISFFFNKKNSNWLKTSLILLTIGSIGVGIMFGQSRNTLISILAIIFIYLLFINARMKGQSMLVIAIGAFLFSIGMLVLILKLDDIANFLHFFFISLGGQRITLYSLVLISIGKSWVFGNGIGSFQEEFSYRYDVHNVLLQIANWGGVVALAIFVLLWIYPFVKLLSSNRNGLSPQREKIRSLYWMMSIAMFISIQFFVALNSVVFLMMWGAISTIPLLSQKSHIPPARNREK